MFEIVHRIVGQDLKRVQAVDPGCRPVHRPGREPEHAIIIVVGAPLPQKIHEVIDGTIKHHAQFQGAADPVRRRQGKRHEKFVPVFEVLIARRVVPENPDRARKCDPVGR